MGNEISNQIFEERLVIGIDMAKRIAEQKGLKLTDAELMDIGCRIASTLFIEKNKAYRTSQIRSR